MAMAAAKTGSPSHRSVYLITFSQCDSSELSRVQFAELIVEAWHTCSRSKIIQWVVSLEAHENSGNHFHMAIKLSSPARWLKVRNFVDDKYGIKLNFSNSHANYYTAYEYVVKEDPNFVQSANHPDFSNGKPPKTTKATCGRRKGPKTVKSKKRKRLAVFDVVQIIQAKKIQNRVELLALASKWQGEGKIDLAEFVANRGPKIVNQAIQTANELSEAQRRLERSKKTRIELLEESASSPCVEDCHGQWMSAATEILESNGISAERFSSAVYNALKRGRGKYRNVYLFGPANCGKTFLVSPLKKIFECFVNPASGTFAWLGIEDAEVVLLNDFRWKPSLIPWCELLQVLEGDTVHFPAPKNLMSKDIVLDKDTPFFATSDAPLALINGATINRVNTEMMHVRWNMFQLYWQIPREKQKELKACCSCFAKLIIGNATDEVATN